MDGILLRICRNICRCGTCVKYFTHFWNSRWIRSCSYTSRYCWSCIDDWNSVDANVLIFERIREELKKGKGLRKSVADGFNNALSSILDANITTGLTALILFVFGTGPIKGFATTLLIGIATSLFTAIFITRLFIDARNEKGRRVSMGTKLTQSLLSNINLSFLEKRKIAYVISSLILTTSLISLSFQGLNQGVDFVGGRSYTIRFDKIISPNAVQSTLINTLGSAEVKTFGNENQLKITTKYKVDVEGLAVDNEIQIFFIILYFLFCLMVTPMISSLMALMKTVGIMSSIKVGPTIADDIKKNSFLQSSDHSL